MTVPHSLPVCLSSRLTPAGIPADHSRFQVLHREPHEEPGRPEPEAGPDLSAVQQDDGEARADRGEESQRQRR